MYLSRPCLVLGLVGASCTLPRDADGTASGGPGIGSLSESGDLGDSGGTPASMTSAQGLTSDDDGLKLDVSAPTGGEGGCAEGGGCGECIVPEHVPCDEVSTDLFNAIGLNCPGAAQFTGTVDGSPLAMGLRVGFGETMQWPPREGEKYAVIGSGRVVDLDIETPPLDFGGSPLHCNDDLGEFDKGVVLPAPLRVNNVAGDCTTDPTLIGTGDCSSTIQGQFSQGMSAFDYTEMRIVGNVPETTNSLSYDFAFFSVEYPVYYNDVFNDMYVGWLESESWTGNISFDEMGNPISLNAGFLDFRDDDGTRPEFAGTCMKHHAGTRWLSTVAPVTPGEEFTVVFAIFDLSDSILDSYVFLDNFRWGCDGTDHPSTMPVG